MNIFIIIFFFIINESILTNKEINQNITINDENYQDNSELSINLNITNNLQILLAYLVNDTKIDIDVEYNSCLENISKKYNNSQEALEKLYEGSSKGFLDLSSYINCIDITNVSGSEYNYYTIYPIIKDLDKKKQINIFNETSLDDDLWIFGFCMINDVCNEASLKKLFDKINKLFGKESNDGKNITNLFKNYNSSNIGIIDNLKKYKNITEFHNNETFYLIKRIPLLFLIIQILFIIFKIIPVVLFGCCIKRRYLREIRDNTKNIDNLFNNNPFKNKINKKIRECFYFSDNLDEIINTKKNNELYNNEGLTYIKGIKSLGIFFYIFGTTFIYFFNYPICISEQKEKIEYMKSLNTSFLIIFWRISPALLLSCSGYSLCYKFLNFLDKKLANFSEKKEKDFKRSMKDISKDNEDPEETANILEEQEKDSDNNSEEKSSSKSSSKNKGVNYYNPNINSDDLSNENDDDVSKSYIENSLGIKFYQNDLSRKELNNMFKNQDVNEIMILSKISTTKIPYLIYFNFIFRQIHKLLFIYLGIPFFKYFFPVILSYSMSGGAPLINYLIEVIISKLDIGIGNFLIYENFYELFHKHEEINEKICILKIFSILICEFNYFIIGTLLVFICYKRKYALDQIICVLIVILVLFKMIYILIRKLNPFLFYFDSDYQQFFFNPIFNFDYYLIGMLFGIVNYVLQNEIAKKESLINERPMVGIPIFLSKLCDYNRSNNFIYFILSIILLIIFLIIIPLLFVVDFENIIQKDNPFIIFRILGSFDVDFFLYFFHFFTMACYISGRNIIFKMLNSNMWSQASKLYFWIIMITPIISYYAIYKTETQLYLSFFMVLIYGAICGANLYIISFIGFVLFEVPYKKLIKLYFNISSELSKTDDDEDEDEDNNKNYPLQKSSILTELSEKDLENENNNEE